MAGLARKVRAPVLAVGWIAILAAVAGAQDSTVVVRGVVLDESGEQPLAGAEVTVLVPERVVDTDTAGRFVFEGLPPGEYSVEVRMIGFQPVRALFVLTSGEVADIVFRLSAHATSLPEVVVEGSMPYPAAMADFFRRKEQGHGHFITREDIERERPMLLSDMVDQVPGVRIECRPGVGRNCWLEMGRAQPSMVGPVTCHVQYFIDGVRYGTAAEEVDINQFRPEDIEGIEIYRGASGVPSRYTGRDARCGVVLLWMRIGRRR